MYSTTRSDFWSRARDSTTRFVCRSVGWSVGWSVGQLVGRSHFTFFFHFTLTSLLLPKWSGDHKYGPCPPARDFGSHTSGLVFLSKLKRKARYFRGFRRFCISKVFSLL